MTTRCHAANTMIFLSLVTVSFGLTGCGGGGRGHSGFLSDYEGLTKQSGNNFVYVNPQRGFGDYDRFLVDPVVVHFAPDAKGTSVDPAKLAELTAYFDKKLNEGLSKSYTVVSAPGPGVLRLRVAITDIQKGNSVLNAIPQTKLTGAGLGGASLEAEAIDSQTGARIAAGIDSRKGTQFDLRGIGAFDNARQAIDYWVKNLVKRIDEAHGS